MYFKVKNEIKKINEELLNLNFDFKMVEEDYNNNLHLKINDIDDHLDNPENDFLNLEF